MDAKRDMAKESQPREGETRQMDGLGLESVIERAQSHDDDALGEIYRRYVRLVFGLCRYVLNSREGAEDATSEVFLKLQRSIESYDGSIAFPKWLLRVAGNQCIDVLRRRQRGAKGHWAVVDLVGKGGHIRTVPIPSWAKDALDNWTRAANVTEGNVFRAVDRKGKVWGCGVSQNVVGYVVKTCCERAGLEHIAPHDLRRTCAKLCHDSGGELEQIQFLLGHASVQTTERYLGCKQNLGHPVNDLFELAKDRVPHENDVESARMN